MKIPDTKPFREILENRPELPPRLKPLKKGEDPCQRYLGKLQSSGRRSMGSMLTVAAKLFGYEDKDEFPWENARFVHLDWLREAFQLLRTDKDNLEFSERTTNMMIYAVRGVAKAAHNLELISIDELTRINDVKPLKIDRLPAGRAVDSDDFAALLTVCRDDERPAGKRDLAIINSLYIAGLRRSEAAKLTIDNYVITKDKSTKERYAYFHFIGKGKKEANCYLDDETMSAMDDWMTERGYEPGPLFCSISKGGKINTQRHMSEQSIYNIVRGRSQQAGIPLISPHDMRRSLATDLLNEKKVPIKRVQNIMRHADIRTTAIYVRDDEDENRKAIKSLRK